MELLFTYIPDPFSLTDNYSNLGQLSLVYILRKEGLDCEICDFNELYYNSQIKNEEGDLKKDINKMAYYLKAYKPKIISFYTMCSNILLSLYVAKRIKELDSNIIIIFAGPHASMVSEEIISKFKFIDLVAIGEGENTIVNNVKYILSNKFNLCENICYKNGDNVVKKWDCKNRINCDEISSNHYELKYNKLSPNKVLSIEGGRGCPFSCVFCSTKLFWGQQFKIRKVESVINDITYYYNKFGCQYFEISHDLFTLNKAFLHEFCNLLVKKRLNIKWSCSSRLDVIDIEDLKLMSLSGCKAIFFGLESASSRIQKVIRKNLKLNNIQKIVKELLINDMKGVFSFIHGFPQENYDDLNETLKMIHKIKNIEYESATNNGKIEIQFHRIAFLPGTEIANEYYYDLIFDRIENMGYVNTYYEYEKDMIDCVKNNKKIFLHCFNLEKNNSDFMRHLGYFVDLFYNDYYFDFKESFDKEVLEYNKDFIHVFLKYWETGYLKYICDINYLNNRLGKTEKTELTKSLIKDMMN